MNERPPQGLPIDRTPEIERQAQREAAVIKVRQLPFVKIVREAATGGELECPLLDSLGA
jgi:hypothetical protein